MPDHTTAKHARDERRITRRGALGALAGLAAAACVGKRAEPRGSRDEGRFSIRISLAEWSLHRPLFAGEMTNLDFPGEARAMGFEAVEYVTQFFQDKARDGTYLAELNRRARDAGVYQHLIMVDGEGRLAAPDAGERRQAIEDHSKWLDAAATLGCRTVRVSVYGEGSPDEQLVRASESLRKLAEWGAPMGLNVVVENHGGLSSNGAWLARLMRHIDLPNCGTLPDFGNFCLDWARRDDPAAWYDRYRGVRELMPYAKAVSAKSYDFDDAGNETTIDYARMMRIVVESGYRGWVGVEYEGENREPREGIGLTKALLERVLDSLVT